MYIKKLFHSNIDQGSGQLTEKIGVNIDGTLTGLKIINLPIGPGPFCGMLLSDMGAEVIRVERKSAPPQDPKPLAENKALS